MFWFVSLIFSLYLQPKVKKKKNLSSLKSIDRLPSQVFLAAYLGETAGSAVLAPRGQIPELDIEQFNQLGHGLHCGRHVARPQEPLGLLRELSGHYGCRLARTELRREHSTGKDVRSGETDVGRRGESDRKRKGKAQYEPDGKMKGHERKDGFRADGAREGN